MNKNFECFKESFKVGWKPFIYVLFVAAVMLLTLINGIVLVVTAVTLWLKILYGLLYGFIFLTLFVLGASSLGSDIEIHSCKLLNEFVDNILDTISSEDFWKPEQCDTEDSDKDDVSTCTDA